MKCPFCKHEEDKVIDSRSSGEGFLIRRRRECLGCGRRFTTYERIEEVPLMVIKRDGRRELFDRKKVLGGLLKACEKRSIGMDTLENMVDEIERDLEKGFEKEVPSTEIGELVMAKLEALDDVAYVRFASVYRQFKNVDQFVEEAKKLLK